jgi:hypothetical protein
MEKKVFGEEYAHTLCSFIHPPVTSSLLGKNILLSTLFSIAFNASVSQPFWYRGPPP